MTTNQTQSSAKTTRNRPSDEAIAIHVLHYLTTHQMNGARIHFDELRRALPIRRMELVRVIGRLDSQGLLDASRLRLTLSGFAIGMSLRAADLPSLRTSRATSSACAAA